MGSRVDTSIVRQVATLARISMSEDQLSSMVDQLSTILDYVEQLNTVDTTDVPPTDHPLALTNVLRDDVVSSCWTSQAAMNNAPEHNDGLFRVPQVLDQGTA